METWLLWFRPAYSSRFHRAGVAAAAVIKATAKRLASPGSAARARISSQYFCTFGFILCCSVRLRSRGVDFYRFTGGVFTSQIDILVFHSTDIAAIGAAAKLRNHFS